MKEMYVYIITNNSKTLYIGVTNNLEKVLEHLLKINTGFTSKYNINKLIYCENYSDPIEAISREKTIQRMASKQESRIDRVCESKLVGTRSFDRLRMTGEGRMWL